MQSAISIDTGKTEREITSPEARRLQFEQLFREHQGAICGWILRMVRNRATAEDLTIETFWRVYRGLSRFDPHRPFLPWARRVATRVALDWLRTQRPETAVADQVLEREAARPAEADPVAQAEIRRRVAQAFGRLTPKLRIAATLAVLEELPQREIAESLGISTTAVKVRVFRALRLLRKDLTRQGITP